MRLISILVGTPRTVGTPGAENRMEREFTSAIWKEPVAGRLWASAAGLAGDSVANRKVHGGPDQAVLAYGFAHYPRWREEWERDDVMPGAFGENLTTEGIDVSGAVIGEQWWVGASLVLAVTAPRLPCRTFALWLEQQGWIRRFTRAARPGAYLRVVTPGSLQAGDPVRVVEQPPDAPTIELMFRLMAHKSAS